MKGNQQSIPGHLAIPKQVDEHRSKITVAMRESFSLRGRCHVDNFSTWESFLCRVRFLKLQRKSSEKTIYS